MFVGQVEDIKTRPKDTTSPLLEDNKTPTFTFRPPPRPQKFLILSPFTSHYIYIYIERERERETIMKGEWIATTNEKWGNEDRLTHFLVKFAELTWMRNLFYGNEWKRENTWLCIPISSMPPKTVAVHMLCCSLVSLSQALWLISVSLEKLVVALWRRD